MNYDYIINPFESITYGFLKGNRRIVFIKVGLGSGVMGYDNKYLIMAHRMHTKYGCSVIVASNPNDGKRHTDEDKAVIEQFVASYRLSPPEMLFFGHSNGGIKGLELSAAGIGFSKMVLVNMPLMINYHRTKKYISDIPKTQITAVYGETDPSFSYIPFLKDRFDNLKLLTVGGADHNFKGMLNEFIDLSELLFEN